MSRACGSWLLWANVSCRRKAAVRENLTRLFLSLFYLPSLGREKALMQSLREWHKQREGKQQLVRLFSVNRSPLGNTYACEFVLPTCHKSHRWPMKLMCCRDQNTYDSFSPFFPLSFQSWTKTIIFWPLLSPSESLDLSCSICFVVVSFLK